MAHILVADDEPALRTAVIEALQGSGHTFAEASDLIDVLRHMKRREGQAFDAIVLDHDFKGGASGIEILEKLKPEQWYGRVIMFTGDRAPEVKAAALAMGVTEFLTKPVEASVLVSSVDRICQTITREVRP